ncbi:GNAT family N-acetyltransferase [Agromyces mediolanus]|uniref:GNAT family N-acetyltransferase n=1 Tax=Agromyces mediolanus TaxID=41986 RepID=UPI00204047EF|nr:GNAT family protein [Agromyces mediolanus]MCM3657386.1 GNAT family N-acetyltransferase [Agromyces mediolanus]
MTAILPASAELRGVRIRLSPWHPDDLAGLFEALCRPEVFAGGYGGGPAGLPAGREAFDRWATGYYGGTAGAEQRPFTVRLVGGPDDGRIVGATKLADFDLTNESTHIGWTGYDPRVWGTAVNPEAKLLLLGLAFEHGFGRVKIQADAANARSRRAIEKLGAKLDGVMRRDKRRADGSWRDSAVYSVVIDEWPEVRAGLEARLAALGDGPVTLRT